jgi:hypothetical protein
VIKFLDWQQDYTTVVSSELIHYMEIGESSEPFDVDLKVLA